MEQDAYENTPKNGPQDYEDMATGRSSADILPIRVNNGVWTLSATTELALAMNFSKVVSYTLKFAFEPYMNMHVE